MPLGQAATAALELLKQSQAVIAADVANHRRNEDAIKRYFGIPRPKQWPATLADFYRLVVRGKDETQNQARFKRFLRYQVDEEQQEIRRDMERAGHDSELDALKWRLLQTDEAVQKEVERRFASYETHSFGFDLHPDLPSEWTRLAGEYLERWQAEKAENRRFAGLVRAHMKDSQAQLARLDPKLADAVRAKRASKETEAAAKIRADFAAHPEVPPHKSKKKLTERERLEKLHAAQEKELARAPHKKRQSAP
jgi:hypothetical protein